MEDHQRQLLLSSRDRHPPDEAIAFIENHVAVPNQPMPIFSERVGGFATLEEAARQQEESKAMWKKVDEEKEQLFDLMKQAQQKLYPIKGGQAENYMAKLRRSNWNEVMEEIQSTAQRWKADSGKRGKAMVFIDRVGNHSAALESWLSLLPMGDYGSSICGVFKLAIGAADKYGKAEEVVLEALSEVPGVMENARRYIIRYQQIRGQYLEERTIELFQAILVLLRHVMQFLIDKKIKKVIGSLIKQESYKEDLFKSLEEVKKRVQIIKEEAQQAQGQMLLGIDGKTNQVHSFLQSLLELLRTNPRYSSAGPELSMLMRDSPFRPQISGYDKVNVDLIAASERDEEQTFTQSHPSSNISTISAQEEAKAARTKLLELIRFDPDEPLRDIFTSLQLGYQSEEKSKARTAAMIHDETFQRFMEEVQTSTCLLVNGRDDISAAEGISPLRIVAAELARMARTDAVPVFVVSYFCAEHQISPVVDPEAVWHSSAVSMIASLVGQLLSQLAERDVPTDLSLSKSKWRKVQDLDPEALCKIFRRLVGQTPPGSVVLCVIDEISLYETQSLSLNTSLVVEKLVRLASKQKQGQAAFKLLMTCQDRALEIGEYFVGHTVDLEEEVEGDDSADWMVSTLRH